MYKKQSVNIYSIVQIFYTKLKKHFENNSTNHTIVKEDRFMDNNFSSLSIQPQTQLIKAPLIKKNKWKIITIILALLFLATCFLVLIMKQTCSKNYTRIKLFYPTLQLPIHFSWLGEKPMPTKYVERLKNIKFPYKLLGQKDYAEFADFFNFDKNISVSKRNDAFRLRYLWKYGGIYADLDYIIDYQCLMMKFQDLKGTYFIMEQTQQGPGGAVSSLTYASQPGEPIFDQVTKALHDRQNQTTLNFANRYMELKYRLNGIDLDMCVYHEFDGTWIKDDPNPW